MTTLPLRRAIALLLFTVAALAFTAQDAMATHFRYGTISWSTPNPAQPNVIRVRFDAAFRWSFPWSGPPNACPAGFVPSSPSVGSGSCPPIGATIAAGAIGSITSSVAVNINGGPLSTNIPINNFIVTSINQPEDWMTGTFEVTLTFPALVPGTYTLSFTNCCRVSTLLGGNADANYTVRSIVTVRNPINRPPTSASLPLIRVPHNVPNATFVIPAFDPDGDPLTFSIPTTAESGLVQTAPPGLTLNSATGVVTWNTTPPAVVLNGLYGAQFKVTDTKGASTVVDIMLSPSATVGVPPTVYINGAAAPATFNVLRGTPLSFPVAVIAANATPVTLGSSSLPIGANMSPSLPTQGLSGNVSSTFNWTPAPSQVGSYLISYSGLSGSGQQAVQTVNINVTNNPPVLSCTPLTNVIQATGPGPMPFSINASVTDLDGDSQLVQFYVNGVIQTTLTNQPVPFSQFFNGSLPLGNHTYQVRTTDTFSPTVVCDGTISVVDVTAPDLTVPADADIFATSPTGAVHNFAASATDAVDPAPVVVCSPPSGSPFGIGQTQVVCTASDASGNAVSGLFQVRVHQQTALSVAPVVATAGADTIATAALTAIPGGSPIAGQIVTFTFTGGVPSATAVTDAAGVATVNATFPTAGNFDVTASFLNPAAYFTDHTGTLPAVAEVATAPVQVNAAATSLAALTVAASRFVGEPLTASTVLTRVSAPAGAVSGATINFTLTKDDASQGPQSFTAVTDASGAVSVTLPAAIGRGAYTLVASYPGDSALLGSSATAGTAVYQKTSIQMTNSNATAGALAQVSAILLTVPGGQPIVGQTVSFSFAGAVSGGPALTGAGGVATWSTVFPNAVPAVAMASFANLADYFVDSTGNPAPTTATATVLVASAATSLSLTAPPAALVGEWLMLASTLNRDSAPAGPVQGAAVTYTVTPPSGPVTTLVATTDTNGQSFVTAPLSVAGLHQISVQYAGSASLEPAVASASTVVSQQTTMVANAVSATAGTPVVVSASLQQFPSGGAIAGATVAFDFGGVIPAATATTNAAGIASVTVTFPNAGSSSMQASYAGSPAAFTNASSASAAVTVADGTAPEITYTLSGTLGQGGWYIGDVTVNWSVTDPESAVSSQTGCETAVINTDGTIVLMCSATSAGGTATASVTVNRDATAPVLSTDASQTVSATGPTTVVNFAAATAADPTSGVATVSCTPASGFAFPLGANTVSCSAVDAAGNESTGSFVVTVNDTTAPVLTLPADITVPGTNPAGQAVTWVASASDAVSGPLAVTCTPNSGATFGYATQTVTCSATDAAANSASGSFTVTVTDTTAPQIVPTVTGTMGLAGWYISNVNVTWSVTDAESGISTATGCGPAAVSTDGTVSFTCEATSAGGTSTQSVTVTRDATGPALTTSPNLTVGATGTAGANVNYVAATAVDAASGVASVSCAPMSGSLFPIGLSTVACTSHDLAGNTSNASFTVEVTDTVPPVITATTPSVNSMWPPNHQMVPVTIAVAATDNLGPAPVCSVSGVTSNEPQNGLGDGDTPNDWLLTGGLTVQLRSERAGNGNGRVYTIAVQCVDAAGNAATSTTTVSVPKSQRK